MRPICQLQNSQLSQKAKKRPAHIISEISLSRARKFALRPYSQLPETCLPLKLPLPSVSVLPAMALKFSL